MTRAARLRNEGMARAAAAQERATHAFQERAYDALVMLAATMSTIHIDDMLAVFRVKPQHPNAWGSVWMRAIRNKIIEHSGTVKPCLTDPNKHKHQYPIYRSLLFP